VPRLELAEHAQVGQDVQVTPNGVTMINSANNNHVLGNYFGLDVTGTQAIPNGGDGAEIEDATGNTIGSGN